MKKMSAEEISDLVLFFEIQYKNSKKQLITEELIEDGSNIKLSQDNLNKYIDARINFLVKTQIQFIDIIKREFYRIIPNTLLKPFTEDQLELILNGRPYIDIEDWEINTEYRGNYSRNHKVIQWFWSIVADLDQVQLSKFLQFCTGTSKVPVGGFASLESNRNEIAKFCINHIPYNEIKSKDYLRTNSYKANSSVKNSYLNRIINTQDTADTRGLANTEIDINNYDFVSEKLQRSQSFCVPKSKNFIKAHACFNRIDLPEYRSREEVKEAISFIVDNEIYGFGID